MVEEVSINLMINIGDSLKDVEVWKVDTRPQYSKITSRFRRSEFLRNGLAHAFFGEFLWLCPVNGNTVESGMIESLLDKYFTKYESIEKVRTTITSDYVWFNMGIVLVRDAIQYALNTKFRNNMKFMVKPKRVVYKLEFIFSGLYAGVLRGLSLNRIFRIGPDNICIAPVIIYDCYDSLYRRVEEPSERSKYISKVSRIRTQEYKKALNDLIAETIPLIVFLSDKKLKFESWEYKIGMPFKVEENRKDEFKQATLEEWF